RELVFGPDGNHDGKQDLYVADLNLNAVLRYDGVTRKAFRCVACQEPVIVPEPGRAATLRRPARTLTTPAARPREGWPMLPGRARRPGRAGREGLRAPAGRRPPRRDRRSTTGAPAPPPRRGAAPRPVVATAHGRPRRLGEAPLGPPGLHDK